MLATSRKFVAAYDKIVAVCNAVVTARVEIVIVHLMT